MSEENKVAKPDRIVVTVKGVGRRGPRMFLDQLFKAFEDGYELPPANCSRQDAPKIMPAMKIVPLFIKGYDHEANNKVVVQNTMTDKEATELAKKNQAEAEVLAAGVAKIEPLNSKEELIQYAAKNKIKLDLKVLKQPKAIKKFLLDALKNKV